MSDNSSNSLKLKMVKRKRINSSEPPYSNTKQSDSYAKKELSNSQQVKNFTEIKAEEMINNLLQEDNQSEQKLNSSVISEYVLMDSNMLKTPCKNYEEVSSEYQDSDEIKLQQDFINPQQLKRRKSQNSQKYISNLLKKQTSENNNSQNKENLNYDDIVKSKLLQQNLPDDLQSNKTTSEIHALKDIRQKQFNKPIYFNVLVTGESGLGKSTFIDLFMSKRFTKQSVIRPMTKQFTENRGQRNEGNINFNINMVDTPGYTQGTDIKQWYQDIRNYILDQFEIYNQHEEIRMRKKIENQENIEIQDMRLHVCLYFIQGHRIKKTDLAIIKKLQKYINIIPIMAKGDSYTPEEVLQVKKNLLEDAKRFGIHWFDIKTALQHNPEYQKKLENGPHGPAPPFLMISSIKKIEIKPNYWVFGRIYKWGVCNIEDPEHSDFNLLYSVLIGHLSMDLIEQTTFYYQQYFRQKAHELELKKKEKNEKIQQYIKGTIFTIGLAITSIVLYPVKQSAAKTLNI